jgi:hypothetical protein
MFSHHRYRKSGGGRGGGTNGRGGMIPIRQSSADVTDELLKSVADALGLTATLLMSKHYSDFWTLSVQSANGMTFGVVSHSPNLGKAAFDIPPIQVLAASNNGEASSSPSLVVNSVGLDRDTAIALLRAAGVVLRIYSHDNVKVVRWSLPLTQTAIVAHVTAIDPSTGGLSATSGGIVIPPVTVLMETATTVTFHPFLDARIVYIWKHEGHVFFSNSRRVMGAMSRGHDAARLDAETWWKNGGEAIDTFFPDDDPNGLGITFVFAICDKTLARRTRVPFGEGYIVLMGVMDNENGEMLSIANDRVRLDLDAFENPNHTTSVVKASEKEEKVAHSLTPEEEEMLEEKGLVAPAAIDAADATYELEDCIQETAERGFCAPFPTPSLTCRDMPPRRDAEATTRHCLFAERIVDGDSAPTYILPVFTGLEEADEYLNVGFYNLLRSMSLNANHNFVHQNWHFLSRNGESVIVRARFDDPSKSPNGARDFWFKLTPPCENFRTAVTGSVCTNVALRACELRSISDSAAGRFLSYHGTYTNTFDETLFLRAVEDDLCYEALFGNPFELFPYVRALASGEGIEEVRKFRDWLSENPNEVITSIPSLLTNRLSAIARERCSYRPLQEHEIRTALFGWACLTLATCVSRHHAVQGLSQFTASREMESELEDVAVNIIAPRVGTPPRKAMVAAVYAQLMKNPKLCDGSGRGSSGRSPYRAIQGVSHVVSIATNATFRSRHGENIRDAARSAILLMSGEAIYAAHKTLPAIRSAFTSE